MNHRARSHIESETFSLEKKKLKGLLKLLLKICISGLGIYLVFSKISFGKMLKDLSDANFLYLFAALILFAASKLVSAYRLNHFFRVIGIQISAWLNIRLYWMGMFYNVFLPGGIGGDGYKVFLLTKRFDVATKKIVSAVFLDRFGGMVLLSVVVVILGSFIPSPWRITQYAWILAPIGMVLFYYILKALFKDFLFLYFHMLGYSLVVQGLQTLCAYFILLALGMQENTLILIFLFLVSSIVSVLPVTLGGLGLREATLFFGSQFFIDEVGIGLDQDKAVTLSFAFYLITLFTSLIGMVYAFDKTTKLNQTDSTT